ncbi:hypothetical protein BD626DRAFT_413577 [Schizophyllum amplum]|uniref:C2H2-type domain-containing protein n=1 Tax=Schizophyllum amplum TaxID=97359 RepID=A0A550BVN2_9AGAR|nr:hypothetical protein BD626DRAFT_413577 [Auriculariopsis ampla]
MSNTVASIWRQSLSCVEGLPPTPKDLNEPQYASLVWGRHCYYCGSSRAIQKAWMVRVLYCKDCLSKEFCRLEDLPACAARLRSVTSEKAPLRRIVPYVLVEDKDRVRYFSIEIAKRFATELGRPKMIKGGPEMLQAWLDKNKEHLDGVKEHAVLCGRWERGLERSRQKEKKNDMERRRDLRQHAIKERLIDLGWGDEFRKLSFDPLKGQKQVRILQPLTDEGWLEIKDQLVAHMQSVQRKRLEDLKPYALQVRYRLLDEVWSDWRKSKPFGDILPRSGDLAKFQWVSRVIEETPFDQDVSADDLLDVLKTIPLSFFDEWRARCEDSLVAFLRDSIQQDQSLHDVLGLNEVTRDSLRLAIMAYSTSLYEETVHTYPRVLVWPQLTKSWMGPLEYQCQWTIKRLALCRGPIALARRAVELAGGDAKTMTVEEMDALDPWYYFIGEDKDGMRRAYPWRDVILEREFTRIDQLVLLAREDTIAARSYVATSMCKVFFNDGYAQCTHCEARFSQSVLLYEHLQSIHSVDPPTRQDFVAGPDIHHHATRAPVDLPRASVPAHSAEVVPDKGTPA